MRHGQGLALDDGAKATCGIQTQVRVIYMGKYIKKTLHFSELAPIVEVMPLTMVMVHRCHFGIPTAVPVDCTPFEHVYQVRCSDDRGLSYHQRVSCYLTA